MEAANNRFPLTLDTTPNAFENGHGGNTPALEVAAQRKAKKAWELAVERLVELLKET
ncbi:MAG: hypothetical protein NZ932_06480 [Candidatus Bathyarchaeota archaeon]|nr:hypothetical protein [Candidatus Bathyarchaeota archaeon]